MILGLDLDPLFPDGLSDETVCAIAEGLNTLALQCRAATSTASAPTRRQLDRFGAAQPRPQAGSD